MVRTRSGKETLQDDTGSFVSSRRRRRRTDASEEESLSDKAVNNVLAQTEIEDAQEPSQLIHPTQEGSSLDHISTDQYESEAARLQFDADEAFALALQEEEYHAVYIEEVMLNRLHDRTSLMHQQLQQPGTGSRHHPSAEAGMSDSEYDRDYDGHRNTDSESDRIFGGEDFEDYAGDQDDYDDEGSDYEGDRSFLQHYRQAVRRAFPEDEARQSPVPHIAAPFLRLFDMLDQMRAGRMNAIGPFIADEDFDSSYEALLSLSEHIGEVKKRGLSEEVMAGMKSVKWNQRMGSGEAFSCPVCLETYAKDERLMVLECSHRFHWDCAKRWLVAKCTCPICRIEVQPHPLP